MATASWQGGVDYQNDGRTGLGGGQECGRTTPDWTPEKEDPSGRSDKRFLAARASGTHATRRRSAAQIDSLVPHPHLDPPVPGPSRPKAPRAAAATSHGAKAPLGSVTLLEAAAAALRESLDLTTTTALSQPQHGGARRRSSLMLAAAPAGPPPRPRPGSALISGQPCSFHSPSSRHEPNAEPHGNPYGIDFHDSRKEQAAPGKTSVTRTRRSSILAPGNAPLPGAVWRRSQDCLDLADALLSAGLLPQPCGSGSTGTAGASRASEAGSSLAAARRRRSLAGLEGGVASARDLYAPARGAVAAKLSDGPARNATHIAQHKQARPSLCYPQLLVQGRKVPDGGEGTGISFSAGVPKLRVAAHLAAANAAAEVQYIAAAPAAAASSGASDSGAQSDGESASSDARLEKVIERKGSSSSRSSSSGKRREGLRGRSSGSLNVDTRASQDRFRRLRGFWSRFLSF